MRKFSIHLVEICLFRMHLAFLLRLLYYVCLCFVFTQDGKRRIGVKDRPEDPHQDYDCSWLSIQTDCSLFLVLTSSGRKVYGTMSLLSFFVSLTLVTFRSSFNHVGQESTCIK